MDRLWLCSGCTARSKDNLQSSWLPRQFCSHACEENYESPFFSEECSLPPEMGSGTSASFRPSSSSSAQVHCERRLVRSLPVNVGSDSCATSCGYPTNSPPRAMPAAQQPRRVVAQGLLH